MNKDATSASPATTPKAPPVAAAPVSNTIIPSTQVSAIVAPVSEVCTQQSRPTPSLTTASTSSVSVSPPVTPRPASLTPSPSIQQQFTVHGQFLGPGDHCGPAPNVTVNPLYQPNVVNEQTPTLPLLRTNNIQQQTTPPASDQQIRVLTPSEIMRTLPSLCQENYEPQPLVRTCIQCGRFYPAFSVFVGFFNYYLFLFYERYICIFMFISLFGQCCSFLVIFKMQLEKLVEIRNHLSFKNMFFNVMGFKSKCFLTAFCRGKFSVLTKQHDKNGTEFIIRL